MGVALVKFLQPSDILLICCNDQLKKYIAPSLRLARGALCAPSDVCVRSVLCPFSHFHKTLLHAHAHTHTHTHTHRVKEFNYTSVKKKRMVRNSLYFLPRLLAGFHLAPHNTHLWKDCFHFVNSNGYFFVQWLLFSQTS